MSGYETTIDTLAGKLNRVKATFDGSASFFMGSLAGNSGSRAGREGPFVPLR